MKYFVTPGVVSLTPAALELAKAFASQIPSIRSGAWIVTFSWATARSMIDRNKGTTTDLGPGLDLAAHRPQEVPSAAVSEVGGLKYALQIPADIVAKAEQKIIDIDPSSVTAVRLL